MDAASCWRSGTLLRSVRVRRGLSPIPLLHHYAIKPARLVRGQILVGDQAASARVGAQREPGRVGQVILELQDIRPAGLCGHDDINSVRRQGGLCDGQEVGGAGGPRATCFVSADIGPVTNWALKAALIRRREEGVKA